MTDTSIGIWFAEDYDEYQIGSGRCPECGEDEMDGGRCYYCGFHDYNCGLCDKCLSAQGTEARKGGDRHGLRSRRPGPRSGCAQ